MNDLIKQNMQTQISQLLKEYSDQGQHITESVQWNFIRFFEINVRV